MEHSKETGTDQELMRSMKVSKAVAAMAIPSVISSLVTVVYNMADTFFVGQTGDAPSGGGSQLTNPILFSLWPLPICLVWAEAQWHLWPWERESRRK